MFSANHVFINKNDISSASLLCWAELRITIPSKQSLLCFIPIHLLYIANIQIVIASFVILFQAALDSYAAVVRYFNRATLYFHKFYPKLSLLICITSGGTSAAHNSFRNFSTRNCNDHFFVLANPLPAV